MSIVISTILFILAVIGFIILSVLFKSLRKREQEAEAGISEAKRLMENSQKEIDVQRKEILLGAKEEAHRFREDAEKENREKHTELQRFERRLAQKEETLDRRVENLDKRDKNLSIKQQELDELKTQSIGVLAEQRSELERISNLSSDEAKNMLLKKVEDEIKHETSRMIKEVEDRARDEADMRARKIVTLAIQRCAVDQVSETTVSVVPLPNDEMKGRIIGREGRNIRAFETLTGVDLIIDDTPEAVVLSGFDPVRREIARIALSNLIQDGRIHPGRIEELIAKAQAEVEQKIREGGERAIFETGVTGLDPELVRLLGKMRYRTSYGQNILDHSIEVSHLAASIAAELDVNVGIARRAGLLHDIGKAVDFEVEGPHALIGADLAKKYHEPEDVIRAIASHHEDEEPSTAEAVLVLAADAISAARPGARRETLETYVKRLQKLENVADSFPGVEKTFAVQAGREIRVMVKPTEIDDISAVQLARDTAKRIEEELQYPGQIKVTVIRETRAVEYAK